jgi:hypothetical protein
MGMATIIILTVLLLIAALAPRFGADSRDLRDHAWERDVDLAARDLRTTAGGQLPGQRTPIEPTLAARR